MIQLFMLVSPSDAALNSTTSPELPPDIQQPPIESYENIHVDARKAHSAENGMCVCVCVCMCVCGMMCVYACVCVCGVCCVGCGVCVCMCVVSGMCCVGCGVCV